MPGLGFVLCPREYFSVNKESLLGVMNNFLDVREHFLAAIEGFLAMGVFWP